LNSISHVSRGHFKDDDYADVPLSCWPYYYFTFFCLHTLAMLSTTANPLLYGWLNENLW
jgi:hypothetical protein